MKIIVRAVKGKREDFVSYLKKNLPMLEIAYDRIGDANDTFMLALEMAGNESCIHLEDDIILTQNFLEKAKADIETHPDMVIQFFSMRRADKEIGSRYENGSNYLMLQCTYLPAGYSQYLIDYYNDVWKKTSYELSATDVIIRDFLATRREKYWVHCPSLVQHREAVSLIDKRRSSKRQSKTFIDPIL